MPRATPSRLLAASLVTATLASLALPADAAPRAPAGRGAVRPQSQVTLDRAAVTEVVRGTRASTPVTAKCIGESYTPCPLLEIPVGTRLVVDAVSYSLLVADEGAGALSLSQIILSPARMDEWTIDPRVPEAFTVASVLTGPATPSLRYSGYQQTTSYVAGGQTLYASFEAGAGKGWIGISGRLFPAP